MKNISAPLLARRDGITTLAGFTEADSGTTPLSGAKDGYVPPLDCTFTPVGSLQQFWLLSAAIAHYGSADKVQLPIPLAFASRYPGPVEVNLTVLAFSGTDQPKALLHNPDFATNPGWHKLDTPIRNGNLLRVDSLANDGSDEFIVQYASGNKWVSIAMVGARLTVGDAQRIADRVGAA